MITFLFAVATMILAVLGLAVGLFFGRPPLKGSCGGIACGGACGTCPRKTGEAGR
jgi:hypothetical protein